MTVSGASRTQSDQSLLDAERLLERREVLAAAAAFDLAELDGADRNRCAGGRWMAYMLAGDFAAAWRESDAISIRGGNDPHLVRPGLFHGGKDLRNSRVTVRCLHGLGDVVHFLCYVPKLRALTPHLAIDVPPPLRDLAPYFIALRGIGLQEDPGAFGASLARDVAIEIMELPYLFRTVAHELPIASRYLELPSGVKRDAARSIGPHRCPRVGLVWAAGDWNLGRSIPIPLLLTLFEPFLRNRECEVWNLQGGGIREQLQEQLQAQRLPIAWRDTVECGDGILPLAATIAHMDLVITVDTLAAHLAGALGQPAWVLLQHAADWRWMTGREDSPWYPSLRLFRQPSPGDWPGSIRALQEEFGRWLHHHASRAAVA